MNKKKIFVIFLAALLLSANLPAMGAEDKPPVESFFKDPVVSDANISPDGKYVAFITKGPNDRRVLVVGDTSNIKNVRPIAGFKSSDILSADWVNDNRLIFRIMDLTNDDSQSNWSEFAVNRDGTELKMLITGDWEHNQEHTGSSIKSKLLPPDYAYFSSIHDGSDDVIVSKYHFSEIDYNIDDMRLFRLNTKTLKLTDMLAGAQPKNVQSMVLDLNHDVRVVHTYTKGRDIVSYRAPDSNEWAQIGDFDYLSNEGFQPWSFGGDGNLYVRAPYKGQAALFKYDLKQRKMASEPFLNLAGFDYNGTFEVDYGKKEIVGIHYRSDASNTVWLDPRFKEIQKKVDDILPQTINTINCGDCKSPQSVLITSASDRQPTQYFVYTPTTGAIFGLGGSNPDIKADQMGTRDFYHYAARDGLSIPVYVTMPPGKATGPLPTVVLVHGGPNVRGSYWEWESEAQFLATRGYVVIQPEFRGSEGFGFAHFHAGWKQWGQSMQDDLADAAKWAVAKGWSDPKRIAIAGASYGGYATLMGLIKNPEIFRCGVEWVGVTDIGLMFNTPQNDASLEDLQYNMKTLIGDPKTDAEMFKANSPLANAGRLTQPLLMAHGARDRRVPIVHGTDFRDAVNKGNKNVEWIQYLDERHGWHHENNRIDFWKHVEAFLDQNLKSAKM